MSKPNWKLKARIGEKWEYVGNGFDNENGSVKLSFDATMLESLLLQAKAEDGKWIGVTLWKNTFRDDFPSGEKRPPAPGGETNGGGSNVPF